MSGEPRWTADSFAPRVPGHREYPIAGFAPGNYWCMCVKCRRAFDGDKRAFHCEPCAVKHAEIAKLEMAAWEAEYGPSNATLRALSASTRAVETQEHTEVRG